MTKTIIIFFSLISISVFGQKSKDAIQFVNSSDIYSGYCNDKTLIEEYISNNDTFYFFVSDTLQNSIPEYELYFDPNFTELYKSKYLKNDTIIEKRFWRNGSIKTVNKFVSEQWVYEKIWYSNGQVSKDGVIVNADSNVIQTMTQYHENGQIFVQFYLKGVHTIYGQFKAYYDNGNRMESGSYSNGKKQGVWPHFNELGVRDSEELFDNGVLVKRTNF